MLQIELEVRLQIITRPLQSSRQLCPLVADFIFNRAEEIHRDRPQLHGDLRRSWGEFIERVYAVANGLREMGLKKGDTISVLSSNTSFI